MIYSINFCSYSTIFLISLLQFLPKTCLNIRKLYFNINKLTITKLDVKL